MAPRNTWSISADWIVPGDAPAIRNGVITGKGAKIEQVGPLKKMSLLANHRDLGEVAILPGLVNAHTQLEVTHLAGKLPRRRPMTQWLFAMASQKPTGNTQDAAVTEGAQLLLASGTTALADVSHNHRAWKVLKTTPLRKLCLAEISGIGPGSGKAVDKLNRKLRGLRSGARLRFGVAPHAPYSTGHDLYRQAAKLAFRRGWPVATHLAQTESERQFLLRGTGKFFEFLAHQGMMDSSVPVHGCKPVAFAERVGLFEGPCILWHVNFIDDEELKILAGSGASVVYCPASSTFFDHSGHRYAEMITAGINVALGSDGLACSDSLSMLDAMRRLRHEGRVDNYTILRMATLNGAKALGMDGQIGSLTRGKQADWIVVELPAETHHPLEAIFTSRVKVLQTVIAGKSVFTAEGAWQ